MASGKSDKMAGDIRTNLKNVAKASGRYFTGTAKLFLASGTELVNSEMPTIGGMIETNQDLIRDAAKFLRNPVDALNRAINVALNSKDFKAIKKFGENMLDDLKTGNLYDKDRMRSEWGESTSALLDDFGDFDMSGFDESGEYDESSTEDDDWDKNLDLAEMEQHAEDERTEATIDAIGTGTQAIVATENANAQMDIRMSLKQHAQLMSGVQNMVTQQAATLQSITEGISSILDVTREAHTQVMDSMKGISEILIKIEQNTMPKQPVEENPSEHNNVFKSNGALDIKAWLKEVRKNADRKYNISGAIGMATGGMSISSLIELVGDNPWQLVSDLLLKQFLPKTLQNQMKVTGSKMKNFFPALLTMFNERGKRFGKDEDEGGGKFLDFLLGLLGYTEDSKSYLNLSMRNPEEAGVFSKKTAKAIEEIIPMWLSQIHSDLSGDDRYIYNYSEGKMVRAADVASKAFHEAHDLAGRMGRGASAFTDIATSMSFDDPEKDKDFQKYLRNFIQKWAEDNALFDPNMDQKEFMDRMPTPTNPSDKKMYYRIITGALRAMDQADLMSMSNEIIGAKRAGYDANSRILKQLRESGIGTAVSGFLDLGGPANRGLTDDIMYKTRESISAFGGEEYTQLLKDRDDKYRRYNVGIASTNEALGDIVGILQRGITTYTYILGITDDATSYINTKFRITTVPETPTPPAPPESGNPPTPPTPSPEGSPPPAPPAPPPIRGAMTDQLMSQIEAVSKIRQEANENLARAEQQKARNEQWKKQREQREKDERKKEVANPNRPASKLIVTRDTQDSDLAAYFTEYRLERASSDTVTDNPEIEKKKREREEEQRRREGYSDSARRVQDIASKAIKNFTENSNKPEWFKKMVGTVQDLAKTPFTIMENALKYTDAIMFRILYGEDASQVLLDQHKLPSVLEHLGLQIKASWANAKNWFSENIGGPFKKMLFDEKNGIVTKAVNVLGEKFAGLTGSLIGTRDKDENGKAVGDFKGGKFSKQANAVKDKVSGILKPKSKEKLVGEGNNIIGFFENLLYGGHKNGVYEDEEGSMYYYDKGRVYKKQADEWDFDWEGGEYRGLAGFFQKHFGKQIKGFHDIMFGEDEENDPNKSREKYNKVKEEITKAAPNIGLGAALGAAASAGLGLLFGFALPGGPIFGALMGAAGGIITGSDKFNTYLFGEPEEKEVQRYDIKTGKMVTKKIQSRKSNGLISPEVTDTFKKYAPGIGIGALAGAMTGGIGLLPFGAGPMVGAVLGSIGGMTASSDTLKKMIFGDAEKGDDDGLISKNLRKAISEGIGPALGGVALGAGAWKLISSIGLIPGLATLPGGPIAMLLGGIVGAANYKKINEFFFGEEEEEEVKDKDGNPTGEKKKVRKGGLFGRAYDYAQHHIIEPFAGKVNKAGEAIGEWFQEDVVRPFNNALKPMKETIGKAWQGIKDGLEKIGTSIASVFSESIRKSVEEGVEHPIKEFFKEKVIKPLNNAVSKIFGAIGKAIGAIISAPFKALEFIFSPRTAAEHALEGKSEKDQEKARKKQEKERKRAEKRAERRNKRLKKTGGMINTRLTNAAASFASIFTGGKKKPATPPGESNGGPEGSPSPAGSGVNPPGSPAPQPSSALNPSGNPPSPPPAGPAPEGTPPSPKSTTGEEPPQSPQPAPGTPSPENPNAQASKNMEEAIDTQQSQMNGEGDQEKKKKKGGIFSRVFGRREKKPKEDKTKDQDKTDAGLPKPPAPGKTEPAEPPKDEPSGSPSGGSSPAGSGVNPPGSPAPQPSSALNPSGNPPSPPPAGESDKLDSGADAEGKTELIPGKPGKKKLTNKTNNEYLKSMDKNLKIVANEVKGQLGNTGWNLGYIKTLLDKQFGKLGDDELPEEMEGSTKKKVSKRRGILGRIKDAITGAVGGIIDGAKTVISNIVGGIVNVVTAPFRLIAKAASVLGNALSKVGTVIGGIAHGLLDAVKVVGNVLGSVLLGAAEGLGEVLRGAGSLLKSAIGGIGEVFLGAGKLIKNAAAGIGSALGMAVQTIGTVAGDVVMSLSALSRGVIETVATIAPEVAMAAFKGIKFVAGGIWKGISTVLKAGGKGIKWGLGKIGGAIGRIFGIGKDKIGKVSIDGDVPVAVGGKARIPYPCVTVSGQHAIPVFILGAAPSASMHVILQDEEPETPTDEGAAPGSDKPVGPSPTPEGTPPSPKSNTGEEPPQPQPIPTPEGSPEGPEDEESPSPVKKKSKFRKWLDNITGKNTDQEEQSDEEQSEEGEGKEKKGNTFTRAFREAIGRNNEPKESPMKRALGRVSNLFGRNKEKAPTEEGQESKQGPAETAKQKIKEALPIPTPAKSETPIPGMQYIQEELNLLKAIRDNTGCICTTLNAPALNGEDTAANDERKRVGEYKRAYADTDRKTESANSASEAAEALDKAISGASSEAEIEAVRDTQQLNDSEREAVQEEEKEEESNWLIDMLKTAGEKGGETISNIVNNLGTTLSTGLGSFFGGAAGTALGSAAGSVVGALPTVLPAAGAALFHFTNEEYGNKLWGAQTLGSSLLKVTGLGAKSMGEIAGGVGKALSQVKNLIAGLIDKLVNSSFVQSHFGGLVSALSGVKTNLTTFINEKVVKKASESGMGNALKNVGEKLSKVSAKTLFAAGFAVADFISGMGNAYKYFNVFGSDVTLAMRLTSGVCNCLGGLIGCIPIAGPFLSIALSFFMDQIVQIVYKAIASDADEEELAQDQAKLEQATATYNEQNGTELTVDEYAKQYNEDGSERKGIVQRAGDALKNAGVSIKEGATNLWNNAKEAVGTGWNNLKKGVSDTWTNVKEGVSNFFFTDDRENATGVQKVGNFVKDTVTGAVDNVKAFIEDPDKYIKRLFGMILGTIENIGDAIGTFFTETIPAKIGDFIGFVGAAIGNLGNFVKDLPERVSKWWDTTWETIKTKAGEIKDGLVKFFTELPGKISTWFNNTVTAVKTKLGEIRDGVVKFFTELPGKVSTWFNNTLTAIKTKAGEIRDSVVTWFNETKEKVSTWVATTWDNIKTKAIEIGNTVVNFVTSIPGRISTWLSNTWSAIATKAGAIKDAIFGFITDIPNKIKNWWKNLTNDPDVKEGYDSVRKEKDKTEKKGFWATLTEHANESYSKNLNTSGNGPGLISEDYGKGPEDEISSADKLTGTLAKVTRPISETITSTKDRIKSKAAIAKDTITGAVSELSNKTKEIIKVFVDESGIQSILEKFFDTIDKNKAISSIGEGIGGKIKELLEKAVGKTKESVNTMLQNVGKGIGESVVEYVKKNVTSGSVTVSWGNTNSTASTMFGRITPSTTNTATNSSGWGTGSGITSMSQSSPKWNKTDEKMAATGCGPTAAAMVASKYDNTANPAEANVASKVMGMRASDGGTNPDFFSSYASNHKFNMSRGPVNSGSISESLESDKPVVLMGKSGVYGKNTHYMVAEGKAGNSGVNLIDPLTGSKKTAGLKDVLGRTKEAIYSTGSTVKDTVTKAATNIKDRAQSVADKIESKTGIDVTKPVTKTVGVVQNTWNKAKSVKSLASRMKDKWGTGPGLEPYGASEENTQIDTDDASTPILTPSQLNRMEKMNTSSTSSDIVLTPSQLERVANATTNSASAVTDVAFPYELRNNFPFYLQWDSRWKDHPYTITPGSKQTMGSSACGPTSMAMIMRSYGIMADPPGAADWSVAHDYRTRNDGTKSGFFKGIGDTVGLTVKQSPVNTDTITSNLRKGIPMVASMGPTTFTSGGHFIVLSGITEDGRYIVNDPNSTSKSRAWDPSVFASEGRNIYAVTKDGKGSINNIFPVDTSVTPIVSSISSNASGVSVTGSSGGETSVSDSSSSGSSDVLSSLGSIFDIVTSKFESILNAIMGKSDTTTTDSGTTSDGTTSSGGTPSTYEFTPATSGYVEEKSEPARVWNYFRNKNLSQVATAGLMGNLEAESGLMSNNLQNSYEKSLGMSDTQYTNAVDSGSYNNFIRDSAGYGLAQWTYHSRKDNLMKWAKEHNASIGDPNMQLDHLWNELSGVYSGYKDYYNSNYSKSTLNPLSNAKTVRSASDTVLLNFEQPANQGESVREKRANMGQAWYNKFVPMEKSMEQKTTTQTSSAMASASDGGIRAALIAQDSANKTTEPASGGFGKGSGKDNASATLMDPNTYNIEDNWGKGVADLSENLNSLNRQVQTINNKIRTEKDNAAVESNVAEITRQITDAANVTKGAASTPADESMYKLVSMVAQSLATGVQYLAEIKEALTKQNTGTGAAPTTKRNTTVPLSQATYPNGQVLTEDTGASIINRLTSV